MTEDYESSMDLREFEYPCLTWTDCAPTVQASTDMLAAHRIESRRLWLDTWFTYWCRDKMAAIFQASLNTLFNKKVWILTEISLKHIYKGLIYNTPGLFHITLGAEQATGHHLYDMYDMQLLFHNWAINNILFSDRWHILCTCIGRTNTYKCAILKYVGRWLLLDKNHCFALKKHIYYYQEIDEKQIMFACYFTHLWILV